ncbi:hypothetical protein CEUSTIGMA_g13960.t1 [Chlamydomonas eustigma]|uniref:Uncharacterized protein n=1 Tax=Chlamydomonas eustigma TaxID=1157962 RepID=A0A250XU58_9CHLO|nr:hypothetical protein CEUSTIGMA_g13960.t1 [Chlamydomonas eustigma]|eukprot:GAX86553.1 hypothetical protein CEUSTIGMA_g13960.t1 [Chlamydomonas eustigma]
MNNEDDNVPYSGPDPGASFDVWAVRSRLSESEKEHAREAARRASVDPFVEEELSPLPPALKAATYGKPMMASKNKIFEEPGFEGLCTSINNAGNTIIVGGRNGHLLVVDARTCATMSTINLSKELTAAAKNQAAGVALLPPSCTAVRFMPTSTGTKQAIAIASQGPHVFHVHVSTGKVISSIHEKGNEVNNLAIRSDGGAFATCGSDRVLRLYDERTSQLTCTLDHGDGVNTAGHSNDVFGLAWNPQDPNVLISAGWDHTVQVWDVRLQRSVRSIYGPYICGDALDIKDNKILAGSWRHASPLELWDLGSCKLITKLPFFQPEQDACMPYAAKFGRGQLDSFIMAGGSGGLPSVKVFTQVRSLGWLRILQADRLLVLSHHCQHLRTTSM